MPYAMHNECHHQHVTFSLSGVKIYVPIYNKIKNKKAVLSQGEPRDAAVNFDTYRILQ